MVPFQVVGSQSIPTLMSFPRMGPPHQPPETSRSENARKAAATRAAMAGLNISIEDPDSISRGQGLRFAGKPLGRVFSLIEGVAVTSLFKTRSSREDFFENHDSGGVITRAVSRILRAGSSLWLTQNHIDESWIGIAICNSNGLRNLSGRFPDFGFYSVFICCRQFFWDFFRLFWLQKRLYVTAELLQHETFASEFHWKKSAEISDVQKFFLCMVGMLRW